MTRACKWYELLSIAALTVFSACSGSLSKTSAASHRQSDNGADTAGGIPPRVYVTKVKNLLTGAAPTEAEVSAVAADPSALGDLVRSWLVTPEGKAATLTFFRNSFQQAQTPITDWTTMFGLNNEDNLNAPAGGLIENELVQSFENTAWELAVVRGQPFNALWTTRTFWMTTAMLATMLYEDSFDESTLQSYDAAYPDELSNMYIESDHPVSAATTVTQGGPDTGRWYVQSAANQVQTFTVGVTMDTTDKGTPSLGVNCGLTVNGRTAEAHIVSHPGGGPADYTDSVFQLMLGYSVPVEAPSPDCYNPNQHTCDGVYNCSALPDVPPWDLSYMSSYPGFSLYPYNNPPSFRVSGGQFTEADHHDWRLVTLRDLQTNEKPMRFWDLAALRQASTTRAVPTRIQRVGPFTTPAFLANWTTNPNNQARSTANQLLIISLGASFDGTNTSVFSSIANAATDNSDAASGQTASDAAHASNSACQSCHVALDPLRKFYTKHLSYAWSPQVEADLGSSAPFFNFAGVQTAGNDFMDLGTILANHPSLAAAWVQKACYWINSAPCSDTDPEFLAIVKEFQNGFQFTDMIAALFSSAMVTNGRSSFTQEDHGEVISISRLDHLCKTLSVRLGVANLCAYNEGVKAITPNIPTDGYTRGATEPFQPAQPGLFFRAAVENFCVQIASAVVDAPASDTVAAGPYSSTDPGAATADMVHNLMAILPSDPRAQAITDILNGHYTKAIVGGASAADALRSTFVVACTSPSVVSIGL